MVMLRLLSVLFQIVIGEGAEDAEGMVMIRTSDSVRLPCPKGYISEL